MCSVVYRAVTLYNSVHSAKVVGVLCRLQYTLYRIDGMFWIDGMYQCTGPFIIFNSLRSESIGWKILDVNNL